MQYAPTRVRAKFGGFHISAHGYAQNAPHFTHPNKDIPKTCPILDPNLWRGYLRGVCNTPLHGYMKKTPSFTPKPSARLFEGRMQYAPTRVHEKPARFHISAHGYAKNAPDFTIPNRDTPKNAPDFTIPNRDTPKNAPHFTLPNKDTPKTRPVLGPNLRRGTFRGVCNTPLHVYVQNLTGFTFSQ